MKHVTLHMKVLQHILYRTMVVSCFKLHHH